jgi:hypothetical protein
LRNLLVDETGRKICVDRHLLAGNGVQGETRPNFGDTSSALRDNQEVDRDQNEEDDDADDEVAAHYQVGESADDVACRRQPLFAMRQDEPCGRDVQREPQDGRHQEHGRESRELELLLNPQRHHENQYGEGDRQREAEVDHHRGNGEEEQAQN